MAACLPAARQNETPDQLTSIHAQSTPWSVDGMLSSECKISAYESTGTEEGRCWTSQRGAKFY
uniref:Uncharacterized protein n=1 Tax=Triticum urartu TaxID=4572 RepID=A0A8R7Q4G2_TRIUA